MLHQPFSQLNEIIYKLYWFIVIIYYLDRKKTHEKSRILLLSTFRYPFSFFTYFSWLFTQIKICSQKSLLYFAQIIFCGKSQHVQNPRYIYPLRIAFCELKTLNFNSILFNPLSASAALIQKQVNWLALQINWLVSTWGQHWHLMD